MRPRAKGARVAGASPSCRHLCFVLQVQGAVPTATRHADGGQLPGGWVGHRLEPAETGGFTVKPPVSRPLAGQHGCRWPSSCSCCHPGSLLAHRCPHLCRALRYVRDRRAQPHGIAHSVRARELEHRACTRILPRVRPCCVPRVHPPEALRSQIATRALHLIACCSRRCDRPRTIGSGSGSGGGGVSGSRHTLRMCALCRVMCARSAVCESYSCWRSCVQGSRVVATLLQPDFIL